MDAFLFSNSQNSIGMFFALWIFPDFVFFFVYFFVYFFVCLFIFTEKCKCPKRIIANWYDIPPYIQDNGPGREPSGLFPLLLKEIVPLCCGNCSEGDGPSEIIYHEKRQPNLVRIKSLDNLDKEDTITFPISGKKNERNYQNDFRFMPLISSPGVAFIVVDEPPGSSANAVFNSVLSGWPVLLLTMLMALLSGIIMWGLVSKICSNHFIILGSHIYCRIPV